MLPSTGTIHSMVCFSMHGCTYACVALCYVLHAILMHSGPCRAGPVGVLGSPPPQQSPAGSATQPCQPYARHSAHLEPCCSGGKASPAAAAAAAVPVHQLCALAPRHHRYAQGVENVESAYRTGWLYCSCGFVAVGCMSKALLDYYSVASFHSHEQ